MTLGNIGKPSAPLSWLNKGWTALQDYAHGAMTHFKDDAEEGTSSDVSGDGAGKERQGAWGILAADVVEHNNNIEVRFEIPGMEKKDLQVEFVNGQLIVSGQKHMSRSREEGGCFITERAFGHFQRAIPMPAEVEVDSASASYEDGVLVINVSRLSTDAATTVTVG